MAAEVKLKRATDESIPLIISLLRSSGLPFEDIQSRISCLFIGYAGSEVIGIGGMEIYERSGMLRSLVIQESFRGRGYGIALYKKLIEYAKLKEVETIYLLTTTTDQFFEKIGFERIDRKAAPSVVQNTEEFRKLCPASMVCMRMTMHRAS